MDEECCRARLQALTTAPRWRCVEMVNSMSTIDSINPGQTIRCTVAKEPQAKGHRDTIARLMRRDPENAKALTQAQAVRKRRLNVYVRGNRFWTSREKAARVVRVANGETWNMPFTPDLAADLRSVESYLTIESA